MVMVFWKETAEGNPAIYGPYLLLVEPWSSRVAGCGCGGLDHHYFARHVRHPLCRWGTFYRLQHVAGPGKHCHVVTSILYSRDAGRRTNKQQVHGTENTTLLRRKTRSTMSLKIGHFKKCLADFNMHSNIPFPRFFLVCRYIVQSTSLLEAV